MHNTGQPPYEVYWKPAWQLDSTIKDCDSEQEALAAYKQRTQPPRRTKRRSLPENALTMGEWRSPNLTFSVTPINSDLDIHQRDPTNSYNTKRNKSTQPYIDLTEPPYAI